MAADKQKRCESKVQKKVSAKTTVTPADLTDMQDESPASEKALAALQSTIEAIYKRDCAGEEEFKVIAEVEGQLEHFLDVVSNTIPRLCDHGNLSEVSQN